MLEDGPELLSWEAAEKTLKIVESGTDRMMNIIEHLQNFSYQSNQDFFPVHLGKVLDNSLLLLNENIKAQNIQIEKQYASDLPEILGNALQLEQVFINFIRNAKEALVDQKHPKLNLITELCQQNNQSMAVVIIQDNGSGMDPEVMEKIFNPFFTTKEVGKGTGLGLSISHNIIQNHRGEIHVSNEPGKGCSFEIQFPLHSAS